MRQGVQGEAKIMGSPKFHAPVKLFYGALFTNEQTLNSTREILTDKHGEIDITSEIYGFDYTGYYQKEMGSSIKRIFFGFKNFIQPEELAGIKIFSNEIESGNLNETGRSINLDPGYLTPAKVVLASTKDNIQRIYIGNGIYEEITLYYKNSSFQAFDWTFPDFRDTYIPFFNQLRSHFRKQCQQ